MGIIDLDKASEDFLLSVPVKEYSSNIPESSSSKSSTNLFNIKFMHCMNCVTTFNDVHEYIGHYCLGSLSIENITCNSCDAGVICVRQAYGLSATVLSHQFLNSYDHLFGACTGTGSDSENINRELLYNIVLSFKSSSIPIYVIPGALLCHMNGNFLANKLID